MNEVISVLDNPIWNALNTGSAIHSEGNERVRFMQRNKGLFVGFSSYSAEEWRDLDQWFGTGDGIILFTPEEIQVPNTWIVKMQRPISQLVYDSEQIPEPEQNPRAKPLTPEHVPEMLALTSLTNPGPFFTQTIDLGRYEGIFLEGRLAAMAGQRNQPDPFVEISAVCTHPDFVGKGLAAELLRNQIRHIRATSKIPFLHAYPDNHRAIRVYERIGFRLRREMRVYFLEKS